MTTATRTLVLDAGYNPHKIVTWQRAASLLYAGRAEVVELYDEVFRTISREAAKTLKLTKSMKLWFEMSVDTSDSDILVAKMPAVIRLFNVIGRKKAVKFSRLNVLTRDNFCCQYCGIKKSVADLNYDHVVPKSRGGKTTWDNIVMSCFKCNSEKRNRTPQEAGMTLLKEPVRPKSLPIAALRMDGLRDIPELWTSWLYWNVELEP